MGFQSGVMGVAVEAWASEGGSATFDVAGTGSAEFGVARRAVAGGSKLVKYDALGRWRAGTRMSETIGLEFEQVIGKRILMWVHELSSARGGSSTGINA